ncbi:MAG: N-acetyl-gamma-glutamyl-phosphate reductase [Candidatus Diapherotrites archaeon]|nr:N-acetyl-gamma-glutamyl-phosphate reductase [Candidatus Diapherotrites archaeon]
MKKIGIIGGSGFAGQKLIKAVLERKDVELCIAASTSLAGKKVSEEFPELKTELCFSEISFDELNSMDLVFLSVPHGESKKIVPELDCKIIDLSADYRLSETYGLPEVFGDEIKNSRIVANPGCYATACLLAAFPLKDSISSVVFDCISGYSGGGKNASAKYDYGENIIAYELTSHFHIAEIEKILGQNVSFTPHVASNFAGLMCTAHIFLNEKIGSQEILGKYKEFYTGSFTQVAEKIPSTKDTVGTPYCKIGGFQQDKNNRLVVVSAIDNLLKGAASQAIENMGLVLGLKTEN